MSSLVSRRIVLARRPAGRPVPEDFRLESAPAPSPAEGQVLLRTLFLLLDPYMRNLTWARQSWQSLRRDRCQARSG
ncbi:hypothetical protein [Roseateles sp. L2-2]|uniref:hypothetical protein n=1 Tax=Roseateles sp. L2-2 TaxID=3422597 RepID=UPI003D35F800